MRRKQVLFLQCLSQLIRYAGEQGYELSMGESFVYLKRKSRDGKTFEDGVHMAGSLHYSGLAADLNLFVKGEYIKDGGHEAWLRLGEFWEGLDPLCRWGGRFKSVDSNHFSIAHGGRA